MNRASLSLMLTFPLWLACGGQSANTPPASTATGAATTPSSAAATPPPAAIGEAEDGSVDAKIRASLAGPQRTDAEKARDKYRHPAETLESFGLQSTMTVVELNPGGGWYTAVLAPVLRDQGKLIVVGGDPNGDPASEMTQDAIALQTRFQKAPDAFGKVQAIALKRDQPIAYGAPESADMVLTFRNLHNWIEAKMTDAILGAAFKVLKHGGVLGLTDHRAKVGGSTNPKVIGDTGYVPEAEAIRIVEAAGFKLASKSEVNANPKDTKDYKQGVWTLPPSYALKDVDHAKYEAIGESDRMTLKFVKP